MTETDTEQRRPRPVFRRALVAEVQAFGANFRHVTFSGESLAEFAIARPAQHIKILFPRAGETEPLMPTVTDKGVVYPEGVERPPMRTYTPRHFDPETLSLDVDFYVHGDGPASNWARSAQVGDAVVIAGPGGGYSAELEADPYVIVGDETAMPAVATLLEALPTGASAEVFIETSDEDDRFLGVDLPQTVSHFVARDDPGEPGAALAKALRDTTLPEDARLFVACEASAMRAMRRHLLIERGVARDRLYTRGYWKVGATNHPDHDTGEDD